MRYWLRMSFLVVTTLAYAAASKAADYNFETINVDFPSFQDDLFGCVASGLNDSGRVVGVCSDRSRNSNLIGFLFDGRKFSEIKLTGTKFFASGNVSRSVPKGLVLEQRSVYQNAPFQGGTKLMELNLRPNDPRFRNLPNPQDTNNFGAITGSYFDGSRLNGFLKRQGADLPITVPNSQLTEALGINDLDQIVGDFRDVNGRFRSFIYDRGSFQSVDVAFAPDADSGALGINNLGKVVGCYSLCSHGFILDIRSGQFIALDFPGAVISQPTDINDEGKIVGVYFDGQALRSFLFDGTGFHTIDVPGAFSTNVTGINNAGEIVGTYLLEVSQGNFDSVAFIGIPQ